MSRVYSQNLFLKEEFLMKFNAKVIGTAVAAIGALVAGGVFSKKKNDDTTVETTATTETTTTTETSAETTETPVEETAE